MMKHIVESVESLQHCESPAQEWQTLVSLKQRLQPFTNVEQFSLDEENIEHDFLRGVHDQFSDDENPFPSARITTVFQNSTSLNQFVCYIFNRRFGWSESQVDRGNRHRHEENANFKAKINELLDQFLSWFHHQEMNIPLVESFLHCMAKSHNKPVVRNQTLISVMEWLKRCVPLHPTEPQYDAVKSVLLTALADIWSAVRSSCASRLGSVLDQFSIGHLQDFFNSLVQVCLNPGTSWQAKEGAVMGISSVIRRFQWVSVMSDDPDTVFDDNTSPQTTYFLKFGQEQLSAIPQFISGQIHHTAFTLLAHPQLSIRENAIKMYSSYITKCEFNEALASFRDLIQQLNRSAAVTEDVDSAEVSPDRVKRGAKFMDAYEAEGLLGLGVHLVKQIPPGFLLPNWPLYFSTFSLFLTHPASTVRQVTSTILKYIVAKDSSSPMILKLVLQGLSSPWKPNMQVLMKSHELPTDESTTGGASVRPGKSNNASQRATVTQLSVGSKIDELSLCDSWEWREGRLLSYELIFKFLLKNHWVYTFGASHLVSMASGKEANSMDAVSVMQGSLSFRDNLKPTSLSDLGHSLPLPHVVISADGVQNTGTASGSQEQSDKVSSMQKARVRRRRRFHCSMSSATDLSPCVTSTSHVTLSHSGGMGSGTDTDAYTATAAAAAAIRLGNNRTMTISGYNTPSLRTLVRHYTYYSKPSAPFTLPADGCINRSLSLLKHTYMLDLQQGKESLSPRLDVKSTSPNQRRSCQSPDASGVTEPDPVWLNDVEMEKFCVLLECILYQTVECLADDRWELRRMGTQLLPCLVEVIRWFDVNILEMLWDSHLTDVTSLLSYGSCLALKYSLEHAAQLQQLLSEPPTSWQDSKLCCEVIVKITDCIRWKLAVWSVSVHQQLCRPRCDLLTLTALNTLVLACAHFTDVISSHQTGMTGSIVQVISGVFCAAHPDIDLTKQLSARLCPGWIATIVPFDGFLSCCIKREASVADEAKQVENLMLSELSATLPTFISVCPPEVTASLLPQFCYYIGYYGNNDALCKLSCNSMAVLASRYSGCGQGRRSKMEEFVGLALRQLADIIRHGLVDVSTTRQVVDLYLSLSGQLEAARHIHIILAALAHRLTQVSEVKSEDMVRSHSRADLSLNSNDIPISPEPEEQETSTDEDDPPLDTSHTSILAECHTLNTSNNSGSGSRHLVGSRGTTTSVKSCGTDSESDWSDDEDEEQRILVTVISEFLVKLKRQMASDVKDKHVFERHLRKMSPSERRHLVDTLATNESC